MSALVWDKIGERVYHSGVDRGVLYLKDGTAVVWNGITGIDEDTDAERKSYYLDGVKFLEKVTPGDFSGKLKAFTYPDEFDQVVGIEQVSEGLFYHEQPPKSFNLTYRTFVGNDVEGESFGYKIHLFYNLLAIPDSTSIQSLTDTATPTEFSWGLSGTPPSITTNRPTVHISVDSRTTIPGILTFLEETLYGTEDEDPRFPTLSELEDIFGKFGILIIIDNFDGTWQAIDVSDDYITMSDSTTFRIDGAVATYLDAVTYQLSDTFSFQPDDSPLAELWLQSPDNNIWSVKATDDGTLDVVPADTGAVPFENVPLKAPDNSVWLLTVDNDSALDVPAGGIGDVPVDLIRFKSPDNTIWLLTVENDGHLDINPE